MNGLIYIGAGTSIGTVPARDLTPEEVKEHGGEEALIATGLYQKPGKAPVQPSPKKEKEPKESEA